MIKTFIKSLKMIAKVLVVLFMLSFLLSVVLDIIINNNLTKNLITSYANKTLKEQYGIELKINSMKLRSFPPSLHVYEMALKSESKSEEFFRSTQFLLEVSLSNIFFAEERFLELYVSGMRFLPQNLHIKENPDEPNQDAGAGITWPLPVEKIPFASLEIEHSQFIYQGEQFSLGLEDIHALFSLERNNQLESTIQIGNSFLTSLQNPDEFIRGTKLTLEMDTPLKSDKISIASLRVQYEDSSLQSQDIELSIDTDPESKIQRLALSPQIDLMATSADVCVFLGLADCQGHLTASHQTSLSYDLNEQKFYVHRADGTVEFNQWEMGIFNFYDSVIPYSYQYSEHTVQIDEAVIQSDQTQFATANGTLSLAGESPSLDFSVANLEMPLSSLLDIFGTKLTVVDTQLKTDLLQVRGEIGQNIVIESDDIFLNESAFIQSQDTLDLMGDLKLTLQKDRLRFDHIHIQDLNKVNQLTITGFTTFDQETGLDLSLDSSRIDLRHLAKAYGLRISGFLKQHLRIHGPYDQVLLSGSGNTVQPMMSGRTLVGHFQIGSYQWNTQTQDFFVQDFQLSRNLRNLLQIKELRSEETQKKLKAQVMLQGDDMQRILQALGYGPTFHFELSAMVDVAGTNFEIPTYRGHSKWIVKNMIYNNKLLVNRLQSEFLFQEDYFRIDPISIHSSLNVANGSFQVDYEREETRDVSTVDHNPFMDFFKTLGFSGRETLRGWLHSDKSVTAELDSFPLFEDLFARLGFKGQLSFDIRVRGSVQDPRLFYKMRLENVGLFHKNVAPIDFLGSFESARFESFLQHDGANLLIRFSRNFKTDENLQIISKLENYNLSYLLPEFFTKNPLNALFVSLNGETHIDTADWSIQQSSFFIRNIQFLLTSIEHSSGEGSKDYHYVSLKDRFSIFFADNEFHMDQDIVLHDEHFNLTVKKSSIPLNGDIRIPFYGEVDLELLRSSIPQLTLAEGRFDFSGWVAFREGEPSYEIDVKTSQPVAIRAPWLQPGVRDAELSSTISQDGIAIHKLQFNKGQGSGSASGFFPFRSSKTKQNLMSVQLDQIEHVWEVPLLKEAEITASGTLSLLVEYQDDEPFNFSGNIVIDRVSATQSFEIREEILKFITQRRYQTTRGDLNSKIRFNIQIEADNTIQIANATINTTLGGSLRLTGNSLNPDLRGEIRVDGGEFSYKYERRFQIEQGIIDFTNQSGLDSSIDIIATSRIDSYEVTMAISGYTSNPRVDLTVDPPTRENSVPISKIEILTLLSTGSLPPAERQDITTQDIAKAEGLNIVLGQLETPVEKILEKTGQTVIRRVYFDAYATSQEPVKRLNLPIYLHNDWDIVVSVDERSKSRISLGYDVNDDISVFGSYEQEGDTSNQADLELEPNSGVDLRFKFSFQ